ncbi:hypothetical protein LTR56_013842 [Elasticomyces elasticus]|nr:hypothetical protein LTR56_013842 [Elasticomyces elasticus]KAK3660553.1 hypothetical protein LTR22_007994 [Elasticomyces elasticus]KAK4923833.1 hypothetical protein LTR49_008981 [Elasticomyces elasticus]KAK5751984.1 hypothetical protein LTS12_017917 [Elasticomyces elasticus]
MVPEAVQVALLGDVEVEGPVVDAEVEEEEVVGVVAEEVEEAEDVEVEVEEDVRVRPLLTKHRMPSILAYD